MELTAFLKSFIYLVSSSLLFPVLLLLCLLTLWTVVYSGHFFSMWLSRRRLKPDPLAAAAGKEFSALPPDVRAFADKLLAIPHDHRREIAVLNLLREMEHRMWKSLDGLKMLIRIGPGLGLIGTLIPMGTGLASLGQGDISRLSGDLVIAFTTTVVGMALGLAAYCFFTVRRRWIEEDIKNMELVAEIVEHGHRRRG